MKTPDFNAPVRVGQHGSGRGLNVVDVAMAIQVRAETEKGVEGMSDIDFQKKLDEARTEFTRAKAVVDGLNAALEKRQNKPAA